MDKIELPRMATLNILFEKILNSYVQINEEPVICFSVFFQILKKFKI